MSNGDQADFRATQRWHDDAQLQTLTAMECDFAQGFHLGRPMGADDLARQVQSAGAAPEQT